MKPPECWTERGEIMTNREFSILKESFFRRHGEWSVSTSPLMEGSYVKTYSFKDGAVWYEQMRQVTKTAIAKGIEVKIPMMEIEFWSNEMPSMYLYEPW